MDFPLAQRVAHTPLRNFGNLNFTGSADPDRLLQIGSEIIQFCEIGLSNAVQLNNYAVSDVNQEIATLLTKIVLADLSDTNIPCVLKYQGESIRFEEVTAHGSTKIQVTVGAAQPMFLERQSTFQQLQDFIATDISQDTQVYLQCGVSVADIADFYVCMLTEESEDINLNNIQSEEEVFGGKASEVYKTTYKDGAIYYSKQIQPAKNWIGAAVLSGIPIKDNRFEERSMFSYVMSEILDFHVIPKTRLAKDSLGQPCYIQEAAPGSPGGVCLSNSDQAEQLLLNASIMEQLILLQLLDALLGQVDRHVYNYFIDLKTNKVTGIDNDASGGFLVTHPNKLIPAFRMDGHLPGKFTPEEHLTVDFLKKTGASDPVRTLSKTARAGRTVFLPPVMDRNMVEKFNKLSAEDLSQAMSRFKFDQFEIEAACSRLKVIKSHIMVLEKRQAQGFHSLIEPHEWSSLKTRARLIPQAFNSGNALLAFASYIHRDMQIMSDRIHYKPPEWVQKAFDEEIHYAWFESSW